LLTKTTFSLPVLSARQGLMARPRASVPAWQRARVTLPTKQALVRLSHANQDISQLTQRRLLARYSLFVAPTAVFSFAHPGSTPALKVPWLVLRVRSVFVLFLFRLLLSCLAPALRAAWLPEFLLPRYVLIVLLVERIHTVCDILLGTFAPQQGETACADCLSGWVPRIKNERLMPSAGCTFSGSCRLHPV